MNQPMLKPHDGGAFSSAVPADKFLASASNQAGSSNAEVKAASEKLKAVVDALGEHLVERDDKIELMLTTILAGGHILLESAPGMAKTLTAELLAQALNLTDARIQFTPDTMPSDIRGSEVAIDEPDGSRTFKFNKGPIFSQLVLADEINRGSTKAQAAFFDVMAGGKFAGPNGEMMALPVPFVVVATQNPIEQEGTNPLPEAQLDRFSVKVSFNELSEAGSRDLLRKKALQAGAPSDKKTAVDPVLSNDIDGNGTHELVEMQRLMNEKVVVPDPVLDYIIRLSRAVKPHVGDSNAPGFVKNSFKDYSASGERSAETLMNLARAHAFVKGRAVVEIPDVQVAIDSVLPHRIRAKRGKDATPVREAVAKLTQDMVMKP